MKTKTPTVEVQLAQFGNSSKAEFYPIQANPASSDGRFILRARLAEEIYIVPMPILVGSGIATVEVKNSSPRSAVKKVEIILTQPGRRKIQAFVSAGSADNLIALIWRNEAHYIFPAGKLAANGPITVADRVPPDRAKRLQTALK